MRHTEAPTFRCSHGTPGLAAGVYLGDLEGSGGLGGFKTLKSLKDFEEFQSRVSRVQGLGWLRVEGSSGFGFQSYRLVMV